MGISDCLLFFTDFLSLMTPSKGLYISPGLLTLFSKQTHWWNSMESPLPHTKIKQCPEKPDYFTGFTCPDHAVLPQENTWKDSTFLDKKTRSFSISGSWLLVKILTLDFDFIIMKKGLLHRNAEKGQMNYSLEPSGWTTTRKNRL